MEAQVSVAVYLVGPNASNGVPFTSDLRKSLWTRWMNAGTVGVAGCHLLPNFGVAKDDMDQVLCHSERWMPPISKYLYSVHSALGASDSYRGVLLSVSDDREPRPRDYVKALIRRHGRSCRSELIAKANVSWNTQRELPPLGLLLQEIAYR